ncbi:MAG: RidA family protein [Acinetobacter sp.]
MKLPFSKAVESNGLLFLSGEVPMDTTGNIPEGITAQTQQVFKNISQTLAQHGAQFTDVMSVTVYLTDKTDFAAFNEAYKAYFVEPYPVRTTVIADLVIDAKVEITVIAKLKG